MSKFQMMLGIKYKFENELNKQIDKYCITVAIDNDISN